MPHNLLITNVRPMDLSGPVSIAIEDGVITAVGPDIAAPSPNTRTLDGGGALVFPGFVDAHTHMDKSLLGLPWLRHEVGPTLMDKIVNERRLVREMHIDSHERSMEQIRREVANGTTSIRTFSDINTEWGLDGFHGLLRTREAIGDLVDLQIVVFPQSGMLIRPGTVELMDQAMSRRGRCRRRHRPVQRRPRPRRARRHDLPAGGEARRRCRYPFTRAGRAGRVLA